MLKVCFILFFIVHFSSSFLESQGGDPYCLIEVPSNEPILLSKQLSSFDVVSKSENSVSLVVSKQDLALFKDYEIHEYAKTAPPSGYKNLDTIIKVLKDVNTKFPVITKYVDLSKEFNIHTIKNNSVHCLKISQDASRDLGKPNILMLATHHSRELINAELTLNIIKDLTENYGKDPLWTSFVNKYQIYVIPVVNPDGYKHVFESNTMWRKNLRNGYGVDLNRNYNMGWNSRCGGSTITSSQTYRGTSPMSEAEPKVIEALTSKYPFAKVIDFHSYGRIIFAGYSFCTPGPKPLNDYILRKGAVLAQKANYQRPPIEDTDGMHPLHHLKHSTYYSFLIETYTSSFQPSFALAQQEIARVRPLWVEFLNQSIPVSGTVTDFASGSPIDGASYKIKEFNWTLGETRRTDAFGLYHYFGPGGNYNFVFSKSGYQDKSVSVHIPEETLHLEVKLNVKLTKN